MIYGGRLIGIKIPDAKISSSIIEMAIKVDFLNQNFFDKVDSNETVDADEVLFSRYASLILGSNI